MLVGAKALPETHPKGGKSHASEPEGRGQLGVFTQHGVQSPSVPGRRGELPRPLEEELAQHAAAPTASGACPLQVPSADISEGGTQWTLLT